ncbi:MAG: hypothetical protein A3G32_06400 [Deltaproteobacteria bacterium RIFCSPLOWO2_12_FULL_40_28]|nr:MAG: hypothetical protein A3C45_02495 [Deltaproteobacteria bacterium RIFCSPHIGHO2_02_FULL_40_28]OGQ19081.1 MAG: hypothetical protein A3E27_05585 [Deltaproteobacteria bacterium RIFCSPHIGHO2_12_FULL_40_32]OGQ40253.1 MAG: hypothetical protein A3I69_01025 [Deltaproteobacteria bacterium RIFCSPLOWO2_02_FULL_40_36]OGQ53524.1 MAG: hypothetical protein A3G32_06400 [Deltaproteobacteria bacterium RIFCSPLOWO2_12_FULL_40_28]
MKRLTFPKSLEPVFSALAKVLVPAQDDLILEGFEAHFFFNFGRIFNELPPIFRWGFIWGIRFFDWFPVLFGFGLNRFSHLSFESAKKYVDAWANGRLGVCREFFKTLKAMVILVYFSEPKVWEVIGYAPENHLKERIEMRKKILSGGEEKVHWPHEEETNA